MQGSAAQLCCGRCAKYRFSNWPMIRIAAALRFGMQHGMQAAVRSDTNLYSRHRSHPHRRRRPVQRLQIGDRVLRFPLCRLPPSLQTKTLTVVTFTCLSHIRTSKSSARYEYGIPQATSSDREIIPPSSHLSVSVNAAKPSTDRSAMRLLYRHATCNIGRIVTAALAQQIRPALPRAAHGAPHIHTTKNHTATERLGSAKNKQGTERTPWLRVKDFPT
eukprot:214648-Chlamydomonas_euryale.AAC.1